MQETMQEAIQEAMDQGAITTRVFIGFKFFKLSGRASRKKHSCQVYENRPSEI